MKLVDSPERVKRPPILQLLPSRNTWHVCGLPLEKDLARMRAGRLIRSAEDTGVIALFDRRFLRFPYRDHLPPDWVPDGGVRQLSGDPGEAARRFFLEKAEASSVQ